MGKADWTASRTKRGLDAGLAALLLVLLLPLLALITLISFGCMGRPVFFVQERPGKQGKVFRLIKFRTLSDRGDEVEPPRENIPPNRFASGLRSSGLDELPELWNILKGEMSFVGPRPLLTRYLDRYSEQQARRHEVRPGLTGWAQVHGRNDLDWTRRLEMDVWYVDHATWRTDLCILLRTFTQILSRTGTTEPEEFQG